MIGSARSFPGAFLCDCGPFRRTLALCDTPPRPPDGFREETGGHETASQAPGLGDHQVQLAIPVEVTRDSRDRVVLREWLVPTWNAPSPLPKRMATSRSPPISFSITVPHLHQFSNWLGCSKKTSLSVAPRGLAPLQALHGLHGMDRPPTGAGTPGASHARRFLTRSRFRGSEPRLPSWRGIRGRSRYNPQSD